MADRADERRRDHKGRAEPTLAAGHLELLASDVGKTSAFLEHFGALIVVVRERFAVLELRGGTHIVVQQGEPGPGREPSFDLMVDDLATARELAARLGAEPTPVQTGSVHSSFQLRDPSGQSLRVVSSHTVWFPA